MKPIRRNSCAEPPFSGSLVLNRRTSSRQPVDEKITRLTVREFHSRRETRQNFLSCVVYPEYAFRHQTFDMR
jgi:hypothetical protein